MLPASILITLIACGLGLYLAALNYALRDVSRRRLASAMEDRGRAFDEEVFAAHLPGYLVVIGTLRIVLSLLVVVGLLATLRYWSLSAEWPILSRYAVALVAAWLAVSVLFLALPMAIARYGREPMLARHLGVVRLLRTLCLPLVALLQGLDSLVQRLLGIDPMVRAEDADLSDEVMTVVQDHEGEAVGEEQREMLEAIFELPNTTAEEIMTPRTDVHGIEAGATLAEVKAFILEVGHSRIPVFEGNLDNIKGILYAKDLIRFVGDGESFNLTELLRDPLLVPEGKAVIDLLRDFKSTKVHMAIVIDEYGGTAGLITIEDIIEELVGEIQDEYEEPDEQPMIRPVEDGVYDIDARAYIDDVNHELELDLPEAEDYDTLGGLVVSKLGHIPVPGESFELEQLRMTVTEAERTRVKNVRIEVLAPQAEEAPSG